jgi:superfamily II helicase
MRETLQMCVSISNMQACDPVMKHVVHDKIRRSIADKIASIATVETQHEFHKEYRCRVIVADHDDYWRDVSEAAERLSYRGMSPRFTEEGMT